MANYTLSVSTAAIGIGVLSGVRVVVDRLRSTAADQYPPVDELYRIEQATDDNGLCDFQLKFDDISSFHRARVFDADGVVAYSKVFLMPPNAISLEDTDTNAPSGGAFHGNDGKAYKIVSGVIRQTSSGSGWALIDDANHSPVNVDSVSVNGSGDLYISYASIGAVNKAYFSAWPDETFAGWGMRMGCSAGNTSATIEIYAPYGGAIVASSATPVQPIIPLGHVVTQTLDAAKGTLVIAHDTQSHSSGNGSPVSVVSSGNNGIWTVTSTKSDFTLTYRRQCVGAISWGGGNPSVNTAIAYPGPYNVTATSSSSGKIRLDIGTHELYAGMAVDVADITGTTEANDRWYIDSVGSGYIVLGNSVTTGLPSAYVNPWVSGGTVTMVKAIWKTDHIEVFHPYAGSQQFVQCQMHKGTTWLDCKIDNSSITTYGFHAYFYDNAGALVTSPSTDMKFSYQRDVWLPAAIPASNVGQVTRDNIHCNASGIYNANGNIWFCGIFEV